MPPITRYEVFLHGWRHWLTGPNPSGLQRVARGLLRVGSAPYGLVVAVRNKLFDWGIKTTHRCSSPVVSIGNLSVGGTGKSPTVAWVAQWFLNRGLRVAILSRGYKSLDEGRNDEALELEFKLPNVPHLQNPDRVASATRAIDECQSQVLVLDDGFQHRRLYRDLDIVLIDATDSPEAQRLLPAGLRRETMSSLRRAHAVIITRSDAVDLQKLDQLRSRIRREYPHVACAKASHCPKGFVEYPDRRIAIEQLQGTPALAFCGIGNPQAFIDSLEKLGLRVEGHQAFPDHHAYTESDIDRIRQWASAFREDAVLVCTLKDWVKIQQTQIGTRRLLALEIELAITEGQAELERLLADIEPRP